ncbi:MULTISPECIES: DGQHR domain-containing protein DpdB [Streptomyces]|uniref:DGQHR domain-containing protein n=2 Tax=Streptomyces TaxID=1883 RepID=A0AA44DC68_STRE0|nr:MULTISPECIES: DGQHR domain-containing protein DpdB [Streptomyces]MBZ6111176.1 DGQHR domain-containing protein [Streptomyces olivaceus]MBZ6127736.1 DGQHR domain-containing protein [Streptomyces olivaceus]MBZ6145512.1 DGQHR domain-containing protein [Streptomyces olivaceus]MBZ6159482.1 DGQHR domain-containing protein [Streptomyces olivaceus]MBZ6187259.1 DGQHR domain-containing protein [Streptomyces olivaceus]
MTENLITRRALRINQHPDIPLYLFALEAGEVDLVADVARISRDEAGKLLGYQRPEKKQHVKQILEYLDGDEVLFPNGLILALPSSVRFRGSRGPNPSDGLATIGMLEIPLPESREAPRPALIVDGQQRSLALARTRNAKLPITVAGFVSEDLHVQREQFLRVNTVSPLPSDLVSELLPEVNTQLPTKLSARKLPAILVNALSQDGDSPFKGLIKQASTTASRKSETVVKDNSLLQAITASLSPSGVLFPYKDLSSGTIDTSTIRKILVVYWTAVRDTFPDAWGISPNKSRLMHGVGIRSMGQLMDRVMERVMFEVDINSDEAYSKVMAELALVEPYCRWTKGRWPEINYNWNELENITKHINILSNYLIRVYQKARMGAA